MTNVFKDIKQDLFEHFQKRVELNESEVKTVSCPYPVTLLGSHNDLFGGKSLSFCLDIYSTLLFIPASEPEIRLYVKEVPGLFKLSLNNIGVPVRDDWMNYIKGTAYVLREKYNIDKGLTGVLSYPFPDSLAFKPAVIEQLIILALCIVNGININTGDLQILCEEIDSVYLKHDFLNIDSITIRHSKSDTLQYVDFDRSKMRLHKNGAESKCKFIVITTGGSLPSRYSDYEDFKKIKTLLSIMGRNSGNGGFQNDKYGEFRSRLPGELLDLGDYYVSESERVENASVYWKNDNLTEFGKMLSESARERSTDPVMKKLIDKLNGIDGVYGTQISSNSEIILFSNLFLVDKIKEQLHSIFKNHDININSGEPSNGIAVY